MARRRVKIDVAAFAADCASGLYTHEQLAARYGLSKSAVEKIVHGRRRPEVRVMIQAARGAAVRQAEQRLAGLLGMAVAALAAAMKGEGSSLSLSAAKEVLARVLGRPGRATSGPGAAGAGRGAGAGPAGKRGAGQGGAEWPKGLMDLSPAVKKRVLLELGWTEKELQEDEEWSRRREEKQREEERKKGKPATAWQDEQDPTTEPAEPQAQKDRDERQKPRKKTAEAPAEHQAAEGTRRKEREPAKQGKQAVGVELPFNRFGVGPGPWRPPELTLRLMGVQPEAWDDIVRGLAAKWQEVGNVTYEPCQDLPAAGPPGAD